MEIVTRIADVRRLVAGARAAGKTVGLVPTMGALHAGHASLIDAAFAATGFVVVSVFVNPAQFGPNEDLARYPRTPEADRELCRLHGASVVFMPPVDEMYPHGPTRAKVVIDTLGDDLCGASRPGHFSGVCTVVAKLFNIVGADQAFFGAKDYQQATIIKRMASDLDFPVRLVVCPTVREADGLAMSSRNRFLSADERKQALALGESLKLAAAMIREQRPPADDVVAAVKGHIASKASTGKIDYVKVVDADMLTPISATTGAVCVAVAVKFDKCRLIDNVVVEARPQSV